MKKFTKVILRIFLGMLILLAIVAVAIKLTFNEDVPTGISGPQADALAEKMLESINHKEYLNAEKISWTFMDKNHYEWFPQENRVVVSWDNTEVSLLTKQSQNSSATKNNISLSGDELNDAIEYALKNFNNDSFWR